MIDMLLSEEGEMKEESIIQISENSMGKHPPVKIKKSSLVKVDPVERYQEVLRNSQKCNDDESTDNKSKPVDYYPKDSNENDEESVKLEDLITPNKNTNLRKKWSIQGKRFRANQNTDRKNKKKRSKNIFFDVCSAKNDPGDEDQVLSLLGSENYDEESIHSHRNKPDDEKLQKPIFFNVKPKVSEHEDVDQVEEDKSRSKKNKNK